MILHSTVLENGLKVYVHEVPHLRTATFGLWVNQGSKDEADHNNGLSHLLEHVLYNSTMESADEAVQLLRARGARLNATTTREFTYYYATVQSPYAEQAVHTLAAMVRPAGLNPAIVERERQVVLREFRAAMNSATQVTDRFAQSIWGDDFLGRMVLGKEENILGSPPDELNLLLTNRYRADNAGLVVVGGIPWQQVFEFAERHFGEWEAGAKRSRPRLPHYENTIVLVPSNSDEVSLCLGVSGVAYGDPDCYAVEMLALLLGGSDQSRLYQEIRQKRGLAYSVQAYANSFSAGGLLAAMVRCHRNDVSEVVRIILHSFAQLKERTISPAELNYIKEIRRTDAFMQMEDSTQMMRLIGRNAMLGHNYTINAHVRAIQAVEVEEILETSRRLFQSRDLGLAVIGDVDEEKLLKTLEENRL